MKATTRVADIRRSTLVLTVECALLLALACEEPGFEPFAESQIYFSIFGVLNASADTQWVRISPLRHTASLTAESVDAVATLEHMGTGELFELHDTLVRFEPRIDGAADEIRQNFWTTHRIEPGATYRLTVTRSDGASSEAAVLIAESFDTVVVGHLPQYFAPGSGGGDAGFVRVREAKHLAFIDVRHFYAPPCDQTPGYHTVTFPPLDSASTTVSISAAVRPSQLPCAVDSQSVFVVASGSDWPQGEVFDPRALGVPGRSHNVQHGIGFLGGVVTKSVPWENCFFPAWTNPAAQETPCEVTYGPRSATMEGSVRDALCSDTLGGAIVELEDPPRGSRQYWRIRNVRTDAWAGTYRIAGLDPGVPYVRRVWDESVWFSAGRIWAAREDTVEFLPGQQLTADFDLERRLSPLGVPLGRRCGA